MSEVDWVDKTMVEMPGLQKKAVFLVICTAEQLL